MKAVLKNAIAVVKLPVLYSHKLFTPTFWYFYTDISAISVTFCNSASTPLQNNWFYPAGGLGANAQTAWADPGPAGRRSSGHRIFYCFPRLPLRGHQGLAGAHGAEDEGGPHCHPDTQVWCWGAGVTVLLGQDRHDRLINALLLRVGLRIGLCWRIHMVWSLHMGGAACQGEGSDVIDMFLNSCKGGGFSKANRSSKDCHNGRRPLCSW